MGKIFVHTPQPGMPRPAPPPAPNCAAPLRRLPYDPSSVSPQSLLPARRGLGDRLKDFVSARGPDGALVWTNIALVAAGGIALLVAAGLCVYYAASILAFIGKAFFVIGFILLLEAFRYGHLRAIGLAFAILALAAIFL